MVTHNNQLHLYGQNSFSFKSNQVQINIDNNNTGSAEKSVNVMPSLIVSSPNNHIQINTNGVYSDKIPNNLNSNNFNISIDNQMSPIKEEDSSAYLQSEEKAK